MTREVKYVFYDRTLCSKPWSCFAEGVIGVIFAANRKAAIEKIPNWNEEAHDLMAYRRCDPAERYAADRLQQSKPYRPDRALPSKEALGTTLI